MFDRLDNLAKNTPAYDFEFCFVNDGSSDSTLEIIKKYAVSDTRVSYVNLSRNFGKEVAMLAGFDHVRGDAMVIIDADLQDPPELIPEMIGYWEEGYDDVFARRRSRKGESLAKKKTSALYYKVLQSSTVIPIQIDTGDFRLLSRRCIEALKEFRESERYTKGMFSWIGFKKKEIMYDRDLESPGKQNGATQNFSTLRLMASLASPPLHSVSLHMLAYLYRLPRLFISFICLYGHSSECRPFQDIHRHWR